MKQWVFVIVGIVLVALGVLWSLQGLGTITGGFMSGKKEFFALGLLVGLVGLWSLYSGVRRFSTVKR